MTNDPLYNQLREISWRRKLTPAEETQLRAWLAVHPEAQPDWAAEAGLSETLDRLPDVPVPSNFTARVLQAVERENARRGRGLTRLGWRVWRWLPRTAVAVLLLSTGFLSYHQLQHHQRRVEMAESLAAVSEVGPLPSPEILKDFDAIRALKPAVPPADEKLLALFQLQ